MSKFLYNIGILLLHFSIKTAAVLRSQKAKDWIEGRRNWKNKIRKLDHDNNCIWIHAASHGEGLMAIPLLKKFPNHKLIISFFSPSGYHNFKHTQENLSKVYLPIDYKNNAEFILKTTNPKLLIFVKYDFWFNLIETAYKLNIPTLAFSSKFYKKQWFLKPSWKWQNKTLKQMSSILTIDEQSNNLLKEKGFVNSSYCGDTRYDQADSTNNQKLKLKITKPCILLGSSWVEEEKIIKEIIENLQEFQLIIAPHSITNKRIKEITSLFKNNCGLYSNLSDTIPKVLIIDNIGLLADLYELSQIAIIGGGFSGKLHNIIEPAAKGNYILFGPEIDKYPEANEMINEGYASTFKNSEELLRKVEQHKDLSSFNSQKFILDKKGATEKVFHKCQEVLDHSSTSASSRM